MARTQRHPRPTHAQTLSPVTSHCPTCGHRLWTGYANYRTITTLDAVTRLTLYVRRCPNATCERYHRPSAPKPNPSSPCPSRSLAWTSSP